MSRHVQVVDLAWILARTTEAPAPVHAAHLGPCRLWNGSATPAAYGVIRHNGRNYPAHRLSWILANGGADPRGLVTRHKCDVRACVEPAHLETGTHTDNMKDWVARGKAPSPCPVVDLPPLDATTRGRGRPRRADGLNSHSEAAYVARGSARVMLRAPVAVLADLDELALELGLSRSATIAKLVSECSA